LSGQEPPVSRWLVRKSDGTELRFPSLDALKSYILSGVVTAGDVVAPEDASWARVEDLAELSALMGMIAPPKKPPEAESSEETPQPTKAAESKIDNVLDNIPAHDGALSPDDQAAIASSPTTRPPPLPTSEAEQFSEEEDEDEPKTVYSGPPAFDHDPPSLRRDPSAQFARDNPTLSEALVTPSASHDRDERENPLSRPLHTTSEHEDALLSAPIVHESDEDLLSRPISRGDTSPQTHEVMTLALKRAQRRRIIIGSIVIGMLVAIAIFFAVRNIQQASIPPDQRRAGAVDGEAAGEAQDKPTDASEVSDTPEPNTKAPTPSDTADGKEAHTPSPEATDENGTGPDSSAAKANAETPDKADEEKPAPKESKTTAKKAEHKAGTVERSRSGESAAGKTTTPTSIDGLLSRAKKIRKKEPKEALRLYKIVLSKNPSHGDAMQLAARAYLQLGRSSDAIQLLKTCRTKRPRFSPCLYYLGRSYERAGQGTAAKKAYKTLVDEFPESSLSTKARKKLGQ